MDFFLDTGPIFGYSNPNDRVHYKDCNSFFNKYGFGSSRYYTIKETVEDEIDNIRDKYRESGDYSYVSRDIELKIKALIRQINDVDHRSHVSYKDLFSDLHHFLEVNKIDTNLKDRDACILSNSFLWDYEDKTLTKPHFVTVDNADIAYHRTELKDLAKKRLKQPVNMMIFTVKEMVEYGL